MQMQCRSNYDIPLKCISSRVRFLLPANNFDTNRNEDRMLVTDNQSVANSRAAGRTRDFCSRDIEEWPVISPVLPAAPGLLNTGNTVAGIAMVEEEFVKIGLPPTGGLRGWRHQD